MNDNRPQSIAAVVKNGLCVGCGLCESVTTGRVKMLPTKHGSLRPASLDDFTQAEEATLLAACPGVSVAPRQFGGAEIDPIWGEYRAMQYAWAGDPTIRHQAATGGVLTALGVHLIKINAVSFVLQVRADPAAPLRNIWTISETVDDVINSTSSRYGATAPLAGLYHAKARQQPFAIIAKPCDLTAVHNLAQTESWVDEYCLYRLAMVCGGQSRLKKSQEILSDFNVAEKELRLFRYRGYGNPGKLRVETTDGRVFEKTYQEVWGDGSGWQIETRCKLCADALGEATDIASADVWDNGEPKGEDIGFNGIVVRSPAGQKLIAAAAVAGDVVLGEPITPAQFNQTQPHQVAKKIALKARYQGMADAGAPVIDARQMRLNTLSQQLDEAETQQTRASTTRRVKDWQALEEGA